MSDGFDETTVTALVVGPCVLGLLWAFKEKAFLKGVALDGKGKVKDSLLANDGLQKPSVAGSPEESLQKMKMIAGFIDLGANAFLLKEYQYMLVFVGVMAVFVTAQVGSGACVAFVVGSITSIISGWVGMKVAVYANVRTTHECWTKGVAAGYDVAVRAGSIMGFCLVSLGVLILYGLILLLKEKFDMFDLGTDGSLDHKKLFEALAGYGLGGSSIALFGRCIVDFDKPRREALLDPRGIAEVWLSTL